MQLLPDERKRLDIIDGILRAESPALASKFDIFTRLAREEGKPPAEKQFRADGAWRYNAFVRLRIRRYYCAILAFVVVALALILTLELA